MRSWRRLKQPEKWQNSTLQIRIDPASRALIERCANSLAECGLYHIVEEMCEDGAFTESIAVREMSERIDGAVEVSLGPMTELVLLECVDVAGRKDWHVERKAKWLRLMMTVAGLRTHSQEPNESIP